MIRKLLVANRGEIACRVMRTARAMGIRTVAVYSDADRAARHVEMADESVRIGPAPVTESYLDQAAILAAARATGADAIHPGYGFLSENPGFVDAVAAAGLIFVGPSATAIRAMGLKGAAKALLVEAGVPVVPGYHGDEQSADFLAAEADKIGYPVLIKAVAGGGGKGMRLVERPQDFAEHLASAQAEAVTAFGNPVVLIEKYITAPRHIEVQVFGDGTRAVHLFERDCSLQRRHQKVIEEAPAPGMTEAVRAAMGRAAVRAAEAIGYSGAGTIEFIVDGSGPLRVDGFWFMEMNTRLQVEHPVTEAVTGLDLVEWQLRVASGEGLPLAQAEIPLVGHAVEARLYAEDPANDFLPVTGRLAHLAFPTGVRTDSGVRSGDVISPWYDPMIAKVVAHGPTREIALAKLAAGLRATDCAGTTTNLPFLVALVEDPDFAAGRVDTGLIARHLPALLAAAALPERRAMLAVGLATLAEVPEGPLTGFSLWSPVVQPICATCDGDVISAEITVRSAAKVTVSIDAQVMELERINDVWVPIERGAFRLVSKGDSVHVFFEGHAITAHRLDPLARERAAGPAGNLTLSPMPGLVRDVCVSVGEVVSEGDRLAVLEAMKMEHVLRAARHGVVEEILVAAGDQVEAGAPMIALAEVVE